MNISRFEKREIITTTEEAEISVTDLLDDLRDEVFDFLAALSGDELSIVKELIEEAKRLRLGNVGVLLEDEITIFEELRNEEEAQ